MSNWFSICRCLLSWLTIDQSCPISYMNCSLRIHSQISPQARRLSMFLSPSLKNRWPETAGVFRGGGASASLDQSGVLWDCGMDFSGVRECSLIILLYVSCCSLTRKRRSSNAEGSAVSFMTRVKGHSCRKHDVQSTGQNKVSVADWDFWQPVRQFQISSFVWVLHSKESVAPISNHKRLKRFIKMFFTPRHSHLTDHWVALWEPEIMNLWHYSLGSFIF